MERVGFEPTIPVSRYGRFRGDCFQPLSHLSMRLLYYATIVQKSPVRDVVFIISITICNRGSTTAILIAHFMLKMRLIEADNTKT